MDVVSMLLDEHVITGLLKSVDQLVDGTIPGDLDGNPSWRLSL